MLVDFINIQDTQHDKVIVYSWFDSIVEFGRVPVPGQPCQLAVSTFSASHQHANDHIPSNSSAPQVLSTSYASPPVAVVVQAPVDRRFAAHELVPL